MKTSTMESPQPPSGYRYINEKGEHLHTYDNRPLIGTSTVTKILNKPLTWWSAGKALEALGWTNSKLVPKEEGIKIAGKARKNFFITNAEYYDWLQECYRAHDTKKKEAGKGGVDLHAELENYVKECLEKDGTPIVSDRAGMWQVDMFSTWAIANVKRFLWSEGNVYSERMWTGGILDVMFEMNDGKICIGDFKSSKEAYADHFIQVALYDIQQSENGILTVDGKQVLAPQGVTAYYIFPFGNPIFTPAVRYNTVELRKGGEAALYLHKLINL